jgi:tetratricopeptide (TPR) repeat protein
VNADESLRTDGIEGEWFRVLLPNGKHAYINSMNVYLPPRTVDAGGTRLGTKSCAPATHSADTQPAGSVGTVLAAASFAKVGLCYRIRTSQGEGWVPASLIQRNYSLPIVQFVAGLYRYQLGRYDLAAKEFQNYVQLDSAAQDPPSLSTAYQLLAASQLMGDYPHSAPALSALGSAIRVTPFDASAFSIRALAKLSYQEGNVGAILPDLSKALELDPDQADARNMVGLLIGIKPGKLNPLSQEGGRFTMGDQVLSALQSLASKYAIEAR